MAFEYTHPVRLDDIDRFDLVFYSRVFVWLQHASEALCEAGGCPYPDLVRQTGYQFPIVSADAEYVQRINWGETVDMAVSVSIGHASFQLDCTGRVDGTRVFDATRTQVTLDAETGEKAPVPAAVRETLAPFAAPE